MTKIFLIVLSSLSCLFPSQDTLDKTTSEIIINSLNTEENLNIIYIQLRWTAGVTAAEKAQVRAELIPYGKSPLEAHNSDGSMTWVFNLNNVSPSVLPTGCSRNPCKNNVIHDKVEDTEEVRPD